MPLYEFRCPNGHDFEKFYRSIATAQGGEKCPECGAVAARLMSAAGLVFKGSGFYITDYGKDGKKAEREAATAQEKSKADATASAEKKTADAAVTTAASPPSTSQKPAAAAKPATESKPAPAAPKPAATPTASKGKSE